MESPDDTMRIAVVTPYFSEPAAILRQCHDSVLAQAPPARHILVADGRPQAVVAGWKADHIVLPRPHGDAGNLARGIGALAAIGEGYDAVAFLDADNWYRPDHLANLRALMTTTGAALCSSARSLHADDGRMLAAHDAESDGSRHVDTNTLLVHRDAAELFALWCEMPPVFAAVGDRLFRAAARARGYAIAHSPVPTVAYRTRWAHHYDALGVARPAGAKDDRMTVAPALDLWKSLTREARRRLLHGRAAPIPPSPPR